MRSTTHKLLFYPLCCHTQRFLPATQGGLPTFVDVGSSFSATQLQEDNLAAQLTAAGKRMVRVACAWPL